MANGEMLRMVMDFIDSHEANWDQEHWAIDGDGDTPPVLEGDITSLLEDPDNPACGTAMCFAGWTVVLAGYKLHWERKQDSVWNNETSNYEYVDKPGTRWEATSVQDEDGDCGRVISGVARDLLELSSDEMILFDASNSSERLHQYVENLVAGRSIDHHVEDEEKDEDEEDSYEENDENDDALV